MAVNKIEFPTAGAPTATSDYVKLLSNLSAGSTGPGGKPITNFGTTSTPQIAQSALFVAAGTFYQADANTAISGSIAADRYIEMVPAGGGATLTPTWTATAPTWSTAYDHFVSGSGNLVLNIMRDEDGYNTYIDIQDFLDVGRGDNGTAVSLLGELARMIKTTSININWGPIHNDYEALTSGIGTSGDAFGLVHIGPVMINTDEGSNMFAYFQDGDETIRDCTLDIATFTNTGNSVSVVADSGERDMALYSYTELTSGDFVYSSIESIRMIRSTFGTSLAQVGNTYTTSETTASKNVSVCVLPDTNYIIRYEEEGETLQAYSWDGTDFSLEATSSAITGAGVAYIAELDNQYFVIGSAGLNKISVYSFDGSTFTEEDDYTTITMGAPRPMRLNATDFLLFNDGNPLVFRFKEGAISFQDSINVPGAVPGGGVMHVLFSGNMIVEVVEAFRTGGLYTIGSRFDSTGMFD